MKERPIFNIILLGDPAAGKATQAEHLVKKYHLFDLDVGRELRELWARNKAMSRKYKADYDKGKITPSFIVRKILYDRISKVPKQQGILFNGTPKQLGEAKLIVKWLKQFHRSDPVFMYLHVPVSVTLKRAGIRKEFLRGKLQKRAEDSPVAIKNRFKYYRRNIAAVVKYFKTKYDFTEVSGIGTRVQVRKRFEKVIDQFLLEHGEVHKKTR